MIFLKIFFEYRFLSEHRAGLAGGVINHVTTTTPAPRKNAHFNDLWVKLDPSIRFESIILFNPITLSYLLFFKLGGVFLTIKKYNFFT